MREYFTPLSSSRFLSFFLFETLRHEKEKEKVNKKNEDFQVVGEAWLSD